MSLTNPAPQYSLGLIAAKDFDSRDTLDEMLGPKLDQISHLHTNGANPLVVEWCIANGVTSTIHPIAGGRGLPASSREVIDASDVVVIIATPGSKSAGQVAELCKQRVKRDEERKVGEEREGVAGRPVLKWRVQQYEPVTEWRTKVGRVSEILACMSKDDLAANGWAKAAWEAVS